MDKIILKSLKKLLEEEKLFNLDSWKDVYFQEKDEYAVFEAAAVLICNTPNGREKYSQIITDDEMDLYESGQDDFLVDLGKALEGKVKFFEIP